MQIDFVITWVDMDDPAWQKDFAKHSGKIDNTVNEVSEARFRDYGLLKYWFRGVEKFAPWVRYVHFVTCGQKPDWLDENHPKLRLVNHTDFIPKEYLPTFNSNVIEIYLHKIPDLAEHFVYFNDDVFLTNHVAPTRFFEDGLPKDIAAFRTNFGRSQFGKNLKNNIRLINKHFNKREVFKRDYDKWFESSYGKKRRLTYLYKPYSKFVTLRTPHNTKSFLKSTFEDVWEKCEDELIEISSHRFRTSNDLTPELFKTWQICQGNFVPYNTYLDAKMFPLVLKSQKAIRAVREQTYSIVCVNDNVHIRNYEQVMDDLRSSFNSILPEKSSFEK
ncbi:MAG TPA: hypothetical protein GXZ87_00645 [Bacteroidales bacterium]|nr:hypothetical protein [Bacteroidales bacterium]